MRTTRRKFIAMAAAAAAWAKSPARSADAPAKRYRAAIIGRTGGGDYGHGYDQIFNGLENVTVVAVADPDAAGRQTAAQRSGAARQYADFRDMLRREQPDLVSIAPRQPDCHPDMCLAAIEAGASLFIEKPFTETPADADRILAAAERKGARIVVAHTRRWTPMFVKAGALLRQGWVGQVRAVRCQGKQDARAGGEDMIVLGTHDFDLMRFYFGNPRWCQASVTVGGRDIGKADVRFGKEPIRVAGDTIHALFAFPENVMLHWSSVTASGPWAGQRGRWGFEILGTRRCMAYQDGLGFVGLDSPFLAHTADTPRWRPLPEPEAFPWPEHHRHPVRSLIHAMETSTQPACSGHDARWTIEMVAAVYEAQRTHARVKFPLADRENPLLKF
ncbi:MAG: Gfo/Idh/MocA family oxidoreductase [Verrucomicrobia bacterium]|nr:Gfo/Idh/MocA family oxidoreductase [Verrucomicrobiota bacterium]